MGNIFSNTFSNDNYGVIEKDTFCDCVNLRSVVIGDRYSNYVKELFRNCRKLKTILRVIIIFLLFNISCLIY